MIYIGIFLGVVSSNCKNFETLAENQLVDAFGVDDCRDVVFMGNDKRHRYISGLGKPHLRGRDTPDNIKVRLDYKTHSFATLTYFFDGKLTKMQD